MRIIFIRHAETRESKNQLYQYKKSPILPIGSVKARQLQSAIERLRPDIIVCSSLLRSKQTARILLEGKDLRISIDSLLDEFREPSSLSGDEVDEKSSYIFRVINRYDYNTKHHESDGESINDIIIRIQKFQKKYETQSKDNILCVGHGFYIKILLLLTFSTQLNSNMLRRLTNIKLEKLKCASFIIEDGLWKLDKWNVSLDEFLIQ